MSAHGYTPHLSISGITDGQTCPDPNIVYTIHGEGFDQQYGDITVEVKSPVGDGWVGVVVGQSFNSDGTFDVSNFGTVGTGAYDIKAWQSIHHKATIVAELGFTLT